MPRVPIFTAEHGPGVGNLPGVPSPAPIESGGAQITEAGSRLMAIQERLQAQQDHLDLYRTMTQSREELGQLQLDVAADPDYAKQGERFQARANEVKYRKMATLRPVVAQAYQAEMERAIAEAGIHVKVEAMKGLASQQDAERVVLRQQAAKQWADADTPGQRQNIGSEYADLVGRAAHGKKELVASMQGAFLTEAMKYLALTNRTKLRDLHSQGAFQLVDPLQQAQILRQARQADEHDQNVEHTNYTRGKEAYMEGLWALANQGLLPQVRLEMMKKGLDPLVDSQHVPALEERNANPIAGDSTNRVKTIMHDYYSGPATPDRIQRARSQLLKFEQEGANQLATNKALKELQLVESTRNNAALQQGLNAIDREFSSEEDPYLPGRIGEMQKFKKRQQEGEAKRRLGEGVPLDQIIRERREQRRIEDERRKQRQSQPDTDMSTILKGAGKR